MNWKWDFTFYKYYRGHSQWSELCHWDSNCRLIGFRANVHMTNPPVFGLDLPQGASLCCLTYHKIKYFFFYMPENLVSKIGFVTNGTSCWVGCQCGVDNPPGMNWQPTRARELCELEQAAGWVVNVELTTQPAWIDNQPERVNCVNMIYTILNMLRPVLKRSFLYNRVLMQLHICFQSNIKSIFMLNILYCRRDIVSHC